MLNPINQEATYSATYVENYLDNVENLPDDVQRKLSRIREIDTEIRICLRDVDANVELLSDATARGQAIAKIKKRLIYTQELGDEKLGLVGQLHELIDAKMRTLDTDFKNLDYGIDELNGDSLMKDSSSHSGLVSTTSNGNANQLYSNNGSNLGGGNGHNDRYNSNGGHDKNKRTRRKLEGCNIEQSNSDTNIGSDGLSRNSQFAGRKKNDKNTKTKRPKTGRQGSKHSTTSREHDDTPPQEEAIDPDEPTYCLCDQISYGEMILCDNDLCPIEWFHFSCVSLSSKPKGKWFCPNCRGDKANVMKPKAQFLKELERYNKEKEEKT